MPKQEKEFGNVAMPKDLPMPKYEYQKPDREAFTSSFSYDQDHHGSDDKKPDICLQNVRLAI